MDTECNRGGKDRDSILFTPFYSVYSKHVQMILFTDGLLNGATANAVA